MKGNNKLDDWKGFFEELQKETDRGAAIVGAAFLDAQMGELVNNFFVEDSSQEVNRLLRDFYHKIKLAYALGLISKNEHEGLEYIRRIRNEFAHELHGLSFKNQKIKDLCEKLWVTDPSFPNIKNNKATVTSRSKFIIATALISQHIKLRDLKTKRQTPAPEFEVIEAITVDAGDKENV